MFDPCVSATTRCGHSPERSEPKAAENEKLKLKATYYNNVAVVVTAAGVLFPLLTVYSHIPEFCSGAWACQMVFDSPPACRCLFRRQATA